VFRFKEFSINDSDVAMKVGTDGVLLGAWSRTSNPKKILDVGCGTGLIALQLAQRFPSSNITAIDIDDRAYKATRTNFFNSPWSERLAVLKGDFLDNSLVIASDFDLIVSNPPYFQGTNTHKNTRTLARNSKHLPLNELIKSAYRILNEGGVFSLILPFDRFSEAQTIAVDTGFKIRRYCLVKGRAELPVKRVMLELQKTTSAIVAEREELVIEIERHLYTEEYRHLTAPFYLNF
jgi:tRNA1Val (adenine37-N6)-methyltransferase